MTTLFARQGRPFTRLDWRYKAACAAIAISVTPVTVFGEDTAEVVSPANSPANSPVKLAANAPYFVTPQNPEKLAALLYPPRVRSAHVVSERVVDTTAGTTALSAQSTHSARFSMAVQFAYDSAKLQRQSLAMLDSIGQMLNLPKVRHEGLVIEGHTDARGSKRYNANLALHRAQTIKRYLADSHGIHSTRMLTVSFGETQLANSENPAHPRNRRAAFRPMRLEDLHSPGHSPK